MHDGAVTELFSTPNSFHPTGSVERETFCSEHNTIPPYFRFCPLQRESDSVQ